MGCKISKIDESELVSLCRERRELIAAAVDGRYALASAHAAYFDALASVGDALQRFVQEELTVASSSLPPGSPVLTIPSSDGKPKKKSLENGSSRASVTSSAASLSHALSLENSHLPLSSIAESEADHDGISEQGKSGSDVGGDTSSSPYRHISSSRLNSSFLRSSMEIPQTFYQDPLAPPWSNPLENDYGYGFAYPSYGVPLGSTASIRDENFGPSSPNVAPATPPPPAPGKTSGWDFLDPFNTYEHLLHHYSQGKLQIGSSMNSPDLSELRKQEGIPDLEFELDAKTRKEGKKENAEGKKQNIMDNDLGGKGSSVDKLEAVPTEDEERKDEKNESVGLAEEAKNSKADEDEQLNGKRGVAAIDKKSNAKDETASSQSTSLFTTSSGQSVFLHATRDVTDVIEEIKEHFSYAADCGDEVAMMLEVDKFPYHSRSKRFGDISSRILDPMSVPALTSSRSFKRPQRINMSMSTTSRKIINDIRDNNSIVESGNLSSTLEKLYLWEEKLYKEVKDEEKLRIAYDKKYKELKVLVYRGAESSKIDMTRILVRNLQTKISVTIRRATCISKRIQKIRDEELQPQLTELVQGLARMWKSVLDCHRKQLKAIVSSKIHKLVAKTGIQRESIAKATKELELELIKWYQCFSDLIVMQKSYIEALNGWLISWLPQEREQTSDGLAPFSPSRIGAPAVFVLSNDWCHANKNLSGKQVIKAMDSFIGILHFLSETQRQEQRRRLEADYLSEVYDKRLESMLEKWKSGHLEIESVTEDDSNFEQHDGTAKLDRLRKRLDEKISKHEETLKQIKKLSSSSLQSGLTPLFEELGNFISEILRAYNNLRIPNDGGET